MVNFACIMKKTAKELYRRWRILQVFVEHGKRTPAIVIEETVCLNCGHVFTGNFCPRCGQNRNAGKGKPHFIKTLREAYPQLSSNFIRTILHLAIRPGYMLRDYFRGHRVLYQNPVSCFLIAISVVALVSSISNRLMQKKDTSEVQTIANMMTDKVSDSMERNATKDKKFLEAYAKWNAVNSNVHSNRISAVWNILKEKFTSDVSLTLFAVFPLLGTSSYLVLRKRNFYGRSLTMMEHYIIYVYLYAFCSFIDWIPGIEYFYLVWTYRGIYGMKWRQAAGYTALIILLVSALALLAFIFAILTMLAPVIYYY